MIRTARKDDLPALLHLYCQLSPEDPVLAPEDAHERLAVLLASNLVHLLVAERDDDVVGTCLLLIIPNLTRGGRPFAIIENVVSRHDARRQGVGLALLADAQSRAWDANCYKIMIATGRKDDAVLRFYERAGFTRGTKTFFEARRMA